MLTAWVIKCEKHRLHFRSNYGVINHCYEITDPLYIYRTRNEAICAAREIYIPESFIKEIDIAVNSTGSSDIIDMMLSVCGLSNDAVIRELAVSLNKDDGVRELLTGALRATCISHGVAYALSQECAKSFIDKIKDSVE